MALIDVVKWEQSPGEIIFHFPEGGISLGAQLIVNENQEAILFKEGRALDSFGPGRHTLKTGNIPLDLIPLAIPFFISSSERESFEKNNYIKASSLSAAFSTSALCNSAALDA